MKTIRIDFDTKKDSYGRVLGTVAFLLWKTNYIPGHPDGEYGNHVRGQIFLADKTELPKADKVIACRPEELDGAMKKAQEALREAV